MPFVTDTHPFLWYLAEDERLSRAARGVFERADDGDVVVVIPSIVLAESVRVFEKRRLALSFDDIIAKLAAASNYPIAALDLRVVSMLRSIPKLPELHDRIIVATARLLDASLITKDTAIRASGYVRTVW